MESHSTLFAVLLALGLNFVPQQQMARSASSLSRNAPLPLNMTRVEASDYHRLGTTEGEAGGALRGDGSTAAGTRAFVLLETQRCSRLRQFKRLR